MTSPALTEALARTDDEQPRNAVAMLSSPAALQQVTEALPKGMDGETFIRHARYKKRQVEHTLYLLFDSLRHQFYTTAVDDVVIATQDLKMLRVDKFNYIVGVQRLVNSRHFDYQAITFIGRDFHIRKNFKGVLCIRPVKFLQRDVRHRFSHTVGCVHVTRKRFDLIQQCSVNGRATDNDGLKPV